MTISKEQWAKVEQAITGIYGSATLICDGHEITLHVERSKQRLVVGIYVDSYFRGKWFTSEIGSCPEQKFFPVRTKQKWATKSIKEMEKIMGKRRCKKEGWYDKVEHLGMYHNTPKAAVAHLKKVCDSVTLKSINGAEI